MITLYGWGPMFDCPSPSPYVMKTEIQMQMLGLDFEHAIADLEAIPKHKAPYVYDGELLIQDSNFIRAYFENKLGKALDDGLTAEQKAASWALERMVEGHLNSTMAAERWMIDANFNKGPRLFFMDVPAEARDQVCAEVRAGMKATSEGTGFGRHSREEQLELAAWDIQAVANQLGEKDFLFGDWATAADAAVSAVLISCATDYFDTPLVNLVRKHANLVAYMDRIKSTFFAENKWPMPEMAMA